MYTILFDIESLLRKRYNSPHYGNKEDIMDELVYILLSKRTNKKCNQIAFDNLKRYFPNWKTIIDHDVVLIKNVIGVGGLLEEKANNLKKLCQKILLDFGEFDIKKVFIQKKWEEKKVFEYLTSLPGIGPKSAYCVMLYSLKLPVMPADAHIIRIFNRLGIIPYSENQHHKAQVFLAEFMKGLSWGMLYSLHVNMKAHGESVCKKSACFREKCVISKYCKFMT